MNKTKNEKQKILATKRGTKLKLYFSFILLLLLLNNCYQIDAPMKPNRRRENRSENFILNLNGYKWSRNDEMFINKIDWKMMVVFAFGTSIESILILYTFFVLVFPIFFLLHSCLLTIAVYYKPPFIIIHCLYLVRWL